MDDFLENLNLADLGDILDGLNSSQINQIIKSDKELLTKILAKQDSKITLLIY